MHVDDEGMRKSRKLTSDRLQRVMKSLTLPKQAAMVSVIIFCEQKIFLNASLYDSSSTAS